MDDRILYSLLGCSIPPPCPLGPPPDSANLLDDIEHLIEEIEIEPKLSQGIEYDSGYYVISLLCNCFITLQTWI